MMPGSGRKELTELTVTIDPPPRFNIGVSAARVVRTAAMKFRFSDDSHSSSVTLANPSSRTVTAPTLFTRMSSPPNSSACATSARGPSGAERSIDTARTDSPDASAPSSPPTSRAPATTRPPSAASALVIARPMPLLAPVTMATLPRRFSSMVTRIYRSGPLTNAAQRSGRVPLAARRYPRRFYAWRALTLLVEGSIFPGSSRAAKADFRPGGGKPFPALHRAPQIFPKEFFLIRETPDASTTFFKRDMKFRPSFSWSSTHPPRCFAALSKGQTRITAPVAHPRRRRLQRRDLHGGAHCG